MKKKNQIPPIVLFKWLTTAIIIGIIVGWLRYWTGYFILIQGLIAGILIPKIATWWSQKRSTNLNISSLWLAFILFLVFLIGEVLGFGWAQPHFNPLGWISRVLDETSSETVFGIYSAAGVVHHPFNEGVNGGFWIVLSSIDLFFMLFFILVSIPNRKNQPSK